ncbi:MAG: phosphatase PAP2 family protein [Steroidobacteraceae bacterium]
MAPAGEVAAPITAPPGEAFALDRQILLGLREPTDLANPIGPDWLRHTAVDLTSLGGHSVLTALVLLVAGFLLLDGRRQTAALVLASSIGASLVSSGLKILFARPRPDLVDHLVGVSTPSFPSGHALASAAIYLTLGALLAREFPRPALRRYFMSVAVALTLLIGMSRVYLGVHWPSDVLAGWCLGALWAAACWRVDKWLQERRT